MPDYLPTATLDMLRRRAALLQQVRRFFDSRGFIEVETPILSHDVVVDRHLDPLRVTLPDDPREPARGRTMWLQTSPEFGMKRLLVAGATAIYQISRVFRGGEEGSQHNPEFTMLEWYRVGDDYGTGMELLSDVAADLLGLGRAERLAYREAFVRYAGFDPLQGGAPQPTLQELPPDAAPEVVNDYLLTTRIEPNLGRDHPTILYDYPAEQAALARVRPGDPPLAERFELYAGGIELANGYHELLDPTILRQRNRAANAARAADGKYLLPEESRLLAAMDQGLPACSGCALGLDRLLMVATGAKSIQEVLAFPIERA